MKVRPFLICERWLHTAFFAEQSRALSRPNGVIHRNSEPKRRLCALSPQSWTCGRTTSGMAWSSYRAFLCLPVMRMVCFHVEVMGVQAIRTSAMKIGTPVLKIRNQ